MSDSPSTPRRRSTSLVGHVVRRGIPLLVLVAALVGAYFYWETTHHDPEALEAAHPQQPIPVEVVTVRRENVPIQLRFLGQTEGAQVVEIRARVAGYLEERFFTEGAKVEEGQRLFQIDPRPFEVEVAQAQAGLASAQATLERASTQLRRFEQLGTQGTVTESEIEEWQTQQRVAAAQVQQQNALIDAAQLQLDYASIESPITGVIGQALKDTGSYVDAGLNGLLAVVQQVDPIYVRYAVTEQEMLRFRRQETAGDLVAPEIDQLELEVTLSDGSTYPLRGRINFVDVQVDETTGTSVVRGEVPNPEGWLKPGQFIYANVLGISRVGVVRVPQGVVTQSPSGATVLVVNNQNMAESRPVVLGDWSGTKYWIIEQGLQPGDRVIASRLMMVRPGVPVTIAGEVAMEAEADNPPTSRAPVPNDARNTAPGATRNPAPSDTRASAQGEARDPAPAPSPTGATQP